jgi:hypothetical protein
MTRPVTAETTARTIEELSALEAPWNALRRSHGSATPNTDPHRFAATVEALGDGVEPHVTLLGEADDPRAIIVARRSTRKLGCRVGYLPLPSPRLRCLDVVYGGLITDGSEPAKQAVCNHLRLTLEARDVDHVMVNQLPTDHELFGRLSRGFVFTPGGTDGSLRPHWQFRFAAPSTSAAMSRSTRSPAPMTWTRSSTMPSASPTPAGRAVLVAASGTPRFSGRCWPAPPSAAGCGATRCGVSAR